MEFRCLTPFKRAQTGGHKSRVESEPILRMRGQTNSRTIDQVGPVLTLPSAAAQSSVYNARKNAAGIYLSPTCREREWGREKALLRTLTMEGPCRWAIEANATSKRARTVLRSCFVLPPRGIPTNKMQLSTSTCSICIRSYFPQYCRRGDARLADTVVSRALVLPFTVVPSMPCF